MFLLKPREDSDFHKREWLTQSKALANWFLFLLEWLHGRIQDEDGICSPSACSFWNETGSHFIWHWKVCQSDSLSSTMRMICPWLKVSSAVARIFLSPFLYIVGLIKPEHQTSGYTLSLLKKDVMNRMRGLLNNFKAMGDFPSIPGACSWAFCCHSDFSFCDWPFYHHVYELNWNNFISLWEKGLHRRTSLCRCSPRRSSSMWSTFISWLKPSMYLQFQIFSHYNS